MSRMSDMLNGKKKCVTTKTNNNREEDYSSVFGKLRNLIEDGRVDLANGLADEIEKNEEKTAEEAVDNAVKSAYEEFEKNVKKSEWSCKPNLDMINSPSYYQGHKFEVIDIIEDFDLNFRKGNALKYLLRAGNTDDYVQDLKKAIWYLNREIDAYNSNKAL